MEDRHPDAESMQASVWLHLQNLKKLAKIVKQVAVILHSRALDGLCRCAGYSDYSDALRQPRPLFISSSDWRRKLSEEFGLAEDEFLPTADLLVWYSRIFVSRGWQAAAHVRLSDRASADVLCQDDPTDETIPSSVSHEGSVVDRIAQREPLSRAGMPPQNTSFDELIPESVSHEQTVVDRIRQAKPRVRG